MVALDVEALRAQFPALTAGGTRRPPIYLDSACTTLRPEPVIQAMADAQRGPLACHGRSNHSFGRATTALLDDARATLARFVGARHDHELVFVRNTTEALNLLAAGIPLRPGDALLTTDLEHNSNLLPWRRRAARDGLAHRTFAVDPARGHDPAALRAELARGDVRVVSIPHVSNLCGLTLPVAEIAADVHRAGALLVVDGAQAMTTRRIDVQALGVDFYAFSAHKMFGPAGVGVLYGREAALAELSPWLLGGGTVDDVGAERMELAPLPDRLEAGIPAYEAIAWAAAAARFLDGIGPGRVAEHVIELNRRAGAGLRDQARLHIIGAADPAERGSVLNLRIDGLDGEALARLLDTREGIMVRHGKQCVHAWYDHVGLAGSLRVSFSLYNTAAEVDRLVRTLRNSLAMIG